MARGKLPKQNSRVLREDSRQKLRISIACRSRCIFSKAASDGEFLEHAFSNEESGRLARDAPTTHQNKKKKGGGGKPQTLCVWLLLARQRAWRFQTNSRRNQKRMKSNYDSLYYIFLFRAKEGCNCNANIANLCFPALDDRLSRGRASLKCSIKDRRFSSGVATKAIA